MSVSSVDTAELPRADLHDGALDAPLPALPALRVDAAVARDPEPEAAPAAGDRRARRVERQQAQRDRRVWVLLSLSVLVGSLGGAVAVLELAR